MPTCRGMPRVPTHHYGIVFSEHPRQQPGALTLQYSSIWERLLLAPEHLIITTRSLLILDCSGQHLSIDAYAINYLYQQPWSCCFDMMTWRLSCPRYSVAAPANTLLKVPPHSRLFLRTHDMIHLRPATNLTALHRRYQRRHPRPPPRLRSQSHPGWGLRRCLPLHRRTCVGRSRRQSRPVRGARYGKYEHASRQSQKHRTVQKERMVGSTFGSGNGGGDTTILLLLWFVTQVLLAPGVFTACA